MQDLVVEGCLTAEVLARLNPKKRYGIWWFNRAHKTQKRVAVETPNGREYKTRSKKVARPRSEWIAVPVPDSGILPELVDAARDATKDNRSPSRAGRRVFDLSGGVLFCSDCGRRMVGTSILPRAGKRYFYYECTRLRNASSGPCVAKIKRVRADILEPRIWRFVSDLLLEPGRLRRGLEAMIVEEERANHGNPDREAKLWHEKLQEAERMRSGYQDLAAKGLLTYEELGEKLAALEETRATARRELEALKGRRERLEALKRDRDALLERYANVTAEALEELSPEERNKLYKMLKLRVVMGDDGTPVVSGVLCADLELPAEPDEISDTRNAIGSRCMRSSGSRSKAPTTCTHSSTESTSMLTRWHESQSAKAELRFYATLGQGRRSRWRWSSDPVLVSYSRQRRSSSVAKNLRMAR